VSARFTRYTLTVGPPPAGAAAVDYVHPEAVALARALGAGGWQETGEGIVFWLPAVPRPDAGLLARLERLGHLDVAAEDDDWRLRWREFHRPVAVGPLYVRAPWHAPRADLLDVCVDVGMAFGTGAHPTTRQCLEGLTALTAPSLAALDGGGGGVLPLVDLGTGSGVLALAAARLGFSPVLGLDVDPVAVDAARANAAANGLAVEFRVADLGDPGETLPEADVAVANLSLPVILTLAERVGGACGAPWRPRRLLLAGLLEAQGEPAAAAFAGYRVRRRSVDEGWLFLDLERVADADAG
jgi:ribosomal protein L11 methyltransferase